MPALPFAVMICAKLTAIWSAWDRISAAPFAYPRQPVGLEPPDEIVQDMIRNLPNAAGYTDSKGLFAPRKAIVHYTQQKHVKGVTVDDVRAATEPELVVALDH